MNSTKIDGADVVRVGPAAARVLEVLPQHDSILRDLEMAMDQVNSKGVMGIVADEQRRKVLDVFISNWWLCGVVQKSIVAK